MEKDLLCSKEPGLKGLFIVAPSTGFEPAAHGVGGHCSIHLSYEGIFTEQSYYSPQIRKSKAPVKLSLSVN